MVKKAAGDFAGGVYTRYDRRVAQNRGLGAYLDSAKGEGHPAGYHVSMEGRLINALGEMSFGRSQFCVRPIGNGGIERFDGFPQFGRADGRPISVVD